MPQDSKGGERVDTTGSRRDNAVTRLDDRMLRLVALFGLVSMIPLAMLSVAAVQMTSNAARNQAEHQLSNAAAANAAAVQHEMGGLAEVVRSSAERPQLAAALATSDPTGTDRATIRQTLEQLHTSRPGVEIAFVTDANGRALDLLPETPSILGGDPSFRDWYDGATRTEGPYVSEAYRTEGQGEPLAVVAAAPIRDSSQPGQPVVGVLGAGYRLTTIQQLADELARAQGVQLIVTDQDGVVVAESGRSPIDLVSIRDQPQIATALSGRTQVGEVGPSDARVLAASTPLPEIDWTLTATIPTRAVLAEISGVRFVLVGITVGLGVLLIGGLAVLWRALDQRARVLADRARREQAFQISRERLLLAMDVADMGAWDWDSRSGELWCSARMQQLYGFEAGTFDGTPAAAYRAVHPEDRDRMKHGLRVALASGSDFHDVHRIVKPDGKIRWIDACARLANGDPTSPQFVGVATDVTERKQAADALRDSQVFLSSVIENIPHVVLVKDAETLNIVQINRAGAELLGRPSAAFLGKSVHDLTSPSFDAPNSASTDRQALELGGPLDIPAQVVQIGTCERIMHTRKIPIMGGAGQPQYLLLISEDITERRHAELELERARCAADHANQSKSEFLSRMSHELRTPLHAILGFAQQLELDALTADQHDNAMHITKAGRHLLALVNEVLDISRIETGHLALSLEVVSVTDVVHEAEDLIGHLAGARGISLTLSSDAGEGLYARADHQRLRQSVLNLLSNAVKYNFADGQVEVRVQRRPGGRVRVSVRDSGPGIHPDRVDLLFLPFERLGAAQSDVEGIGLGLALTKHLVEAMGGAIGFDPATGGGSEFWVDLIEAQRPAASVSQPAETELRPQGGAAGTILCIEDNVANIDLVRRILQRRPEVTLFVAANGAEGVELARRHHPDLVLLDLHLPEMDGETVLRQLNASPETSHLTVIVASADTTPGQIDRLRALGAADYLVKPFAVDRLLQIVDDEVLGRWVSSP